MTHILRKHLSHLRRREEGSVIILVAVTIFLFVLAVGAAIDYSRAQAVQARIQSALDLAGLGAMSESSLRDPSRDGTYRQWFHNQAVRFFNANFPEGYLGSSPVALTETLILTPDAVEPIAFGMQLQATSTEPTLIMQMFGVTSVPVAGLSVVADLSAYRSEFVYVIDTSLGMSQTIDGVPKIQTVQNALSNLINYSFNPTDSHGVYGAIVPFAGAENIGTGYPWMTGTIPPGWSGCFLARPTGFNGALPPNLPYDISEDNPDPSQPLSLFMAYDNTYGSVGPFSHNYGCPSPITTDQGTTGPLLSAVSAMTTTPTSDSFMDLGLAWGWRLLSPNWANDHWSAYMDNNNLPLGYNLVGRKKIMILVTGGQNVIEDGDSHDYNAYGHQGMNLPPLQPGETRVDQLNTRTLQVCTAFKNIDPANNIIFTVGFGTNVNTALLQACATEPSFSYTASTNEHLYVDMTALGREVQLLLLRQ